MTSSALIDAVLSFTDNVDSTDADYTNRRARILRAAQEIVDEVWNYRNWGFAQRNASVAVDSTSIGPLPADFMDIGDFGGVYLANDLLEQVHPQELLRLRARAQADQGIYSIFGEYTSGANKGLKQIHLPKVSSATLDIWYQSVSPTLIDQTDATNNLPLVPVQYHSTVVLAGVVYKTRKSKGEISDWYKRYQDGLAYMWTREKPRKGTVQRMPRSIPGMW
jgi:hypothetical protein